MNCPKCGQASIVRDEEGDDHCYMCSYNSSTRAPTLEEMATSERHMMLGSYTKEPEHTRVSFNSRSLREPLPLLLRRRIDWNTRNAGGKRPKVNKKFNRQAVA